MSSAVLNIEPEHLTGILHKHGLISGVLANRTKRLTGTISKSSTAQYYDGPYIVDPSANSSIVLETDGYLMGNNITVNKIYYAEVSNLANGLTAYIADN